VIGGVTIRAARANYVANMQFWRHNPSSAELRRWPSQDHVILIDFARERVDARLCRRRSAAVATYVAKPRFWRHKCQLAQGKQAAGPVLDLRV
jgi:hypothetical protein